MEAFLANMRTVSMVLRMPRLAMGRFRAGRKAPRLRAMPMLAALLALTIGGGFIVEPQVAHAETTPLIGGVTLDGWGGLHPFGALTGVLNTQGAPYWPGINIARAVEVNPNGPGGWTLDGYGGIHAWGGAPAISSPAYWNGWDIARALVVIPSASPQPQGYLMDGFGGIHPFGGAPPLSGPYWNGVDVARGLVITTDASGTPTGGYLLDAWGGIHPFGSASAVPALPYFAGHDVYQQLGSVNGQLYAVGLYGIVTSVGNPVYTDWTNYSDWGSWNIISGIDISGTSGTASVEPSSAAALYAYSVASRPVVTVSGVHYYSQNAESEDESCEEVSLQMALSHENLFPSITTILNTEGVNDSVPGIGPGYTSADPMKTFVGNPNGFGGYNYEPGAYYGAIASVAPKLGGTVLATGENISPATVYNDIAEGHPVIAWITFNFQHYASETIGNSQNSWPWAGPHEHCVLVVGVNRTNNTVLLYNPWSIANEYGVAYPGANWVPEATFQSAYATFHDMAVVLR